MNLPSLAAPADASPAWLLALILAAAILFACVVLLGGSGDPGPRR